jgi:hypothetical protein
LDILITCLILTCFSFCQRRFRFTSVLLEHLKSHTASVNNIVEMKMKIWVNGRKLKCAEKGCKKKHAYTLEYTKHRDGHSYLGLQCALCGHGVSGPAEYAAHMAQDHPVELALPETQTEDLPPPPAPPTFTTTSSTPSPSPAPGEVLGPVCSPAMFHQPASHEPLQQVHTPMSAPPIMMASPQTLLPPPSPQQPMSAPSSVQFTDEMDFAAINSMTINMPILDSTGPDQINKESEEFMSILNDLNDCTQEYVTNQPSAEGRQEPGSQDLLQQSNAQIMDELERQKENQTFHDNNIEDIMGPEGGGGGGPEFSSPGPHPVILSPRSDSSRQLEPAQSPLEAPTHLAERPDPGQQDTGHFQQFSSSFYHEQPGPSPGPAPESAGEDGQQQLHLGPIQYPEQQTFHPHQQHNEEADAQVQPLPAVLSPDTKQPPNWQLAHSQRRPSTGSGSHPSAEVMQNLAKAILERKRSRSTSVDSLRSEAWSPAVDVTPPLTPQGPPDNMPEKISQEGIYCRELDIAPACLDKEVSVIMQVRCWMVTGVTRGPVRMTCARVLHHRRLPLLQHQNRSAPYSPGLFLVSCHTHVKSTINHVPLYKFSLSR